MPRATVRALVFWGFALCVACGEAESDRGASAGAGTAPVSAGSASVSGDGNVAVGGGASGAASAGSGGVSASAGDGGAGAAAGASSGGGAGSANLTRTKCALAPRQIPVEPVLLRPGRCARPRSNTAAKSNWSPTYAAFRLGWELGSGEIWYDDVALDHAPVACN